MILLNYCSGEVPVLKERRGTEVVVTGPTRNRVVG